MANQMPKYYILTGDPGVGKTTIIKKIIENLKAREHSKLIGFYTEEVKNGSFREGFDIITVDGTRGILARDSSLMSVPTGFKVGKYGVMLKEFENVALPTLKKCVEPDVDLIVIDEIGKMEFLSEQFRNQVKEIFRSHLKCPILATIPSRKSHHIIESIRNNSSSKVWMVTRENRNNIFEEILKELNSYNRKL